MPLDRVRVTSLGGNIGTGYTNFYFGTATTGNLAAIRTLLVAMSSFIPSGITYTIPGSGDTISEADGHLITSWAATPPATFTGTGTAFSASPAGFYIQWKAATVVDNHRPIGRTIIVPAAQATFGSTGGMASGALSTITAAAAAFLSNTAGFAIWHRPVYNRQVKPPQLTRPGQIVAVASGNCGPQPTVLRSRRT